MRHCVRRREEELLYWRGGFSMVWCHPMFVCCGMKVYFWRNKNNYSRRYYSEVVYIDWPRKCCLRACAPASKC